MPHLRLEVPEEWLREEFRAASGFDAGKLLDVLVQTVAGLRMEDPATGTDVPLLNLQNLKHAIIPLRRAHVGGDASKYFLHLTLAMGNDTPGRTDEVRSRAARVLGEEIDRFTAGLADQFTAGLADQFTAGLADLASVTVELQDIDRNRGYSTTAERRKTAEGVRA